MNFKPTKWKIIRSLIIILIINLLGMQFFGGCNGFINCYINSLTYMWIFWVIALIIVYLISSLIERPKIKTKSKLKKKK